MKTLIFLFLFSVITYSQTVVLIVDKHFLTQMQVDSLLNDIHKLELKYNVNINAQYQIIESRDSISNKIWIDKIHYLKLNIGGKVGKP